MDIGSEYVSKLNSYAQRNGLAPPKYNDLGSSGLPPMETFRQSVFFDGKDFPEGTGKSKKEAKHNAAKNAYELCDGLDKESTNFKIKISEYCQRNNCSYNYIKVKIEGPPHDPEFYCKLKIDEKDYPEATGKSVKEAENKAAQLAWSVLQDQPGLDSKDLNESSEDQVTLNTQAARGLEETNFVSKISEYCQQNKCILNYSEVKREGPSHNPLFYFKLVIDKKEYAEAEGKSVREAKQKAAQLAWSLLKDESSLSSEMSDGSAWSDESEKHSGNSLPKTLGSHSKIHLEYDCIEGLGEGAYGCVYKARKIEMDKYFAIKEIQTKDTKKSLQEAKVLADLFHPNIVRYYTCWSENTGYCRPGVRSDFKSLFIEMELCDGGTLRRWIDEKNKEPIENSRQIESLNVAIQILNGVAYIHGKKLIHRDLKPENILFGQDQNVRIGDFGLVTQDHDEGETVERTGDRGTPSYMAPEQVGVNYDRKVDIFASGLIFFELLWRISTGHERVLIWTDVRHQQLPKQFMGTYTAESHIIKTMLREKAEDRPEAMAVKNDLEKLIINYNNYQRNQTV